MGNDTSSQGCIYGKIYSGTYFQYASFICSFDQTIKSIAHNMNHANLFCLDKRGYLVLIIYALLLDIEHIKSLEKEVYYEGSSFRNINCNFFWYFIFGKSSGADFLTAISLKNHGEIR